MDASLARPTTSTHRCASFFALLTFVAHAQSRGYTQTNTTRESPFGTTRPPPANWANPPTSPTSQNTTATSTGGYSSSNGGNSLTNSGSSSSNLYGTNQYGASNSQPSPSYNQYQSSDGASNSPSTSNDGLRSSFGNTNKIATPTTPTTRCMHFSDCDCAVSVSHVLAGASLSRGSQPGNSRIQFQSSRGTPNGTSALIVVFVSLAQFLFVGEYSNDQPTNNLSNSGNNLLSTNNISNSGKNVYD